VVGYPSDEIAKMKANPWSMVKGRRSKFHVVITMMVTRVLLEALSVSPVDAKTRGWER